MKELVAVRDYKFYRWCDIQELTGNLSQDNFIDLMQFGKLYRGTTEEGQTVTVKLVTPVTRIYNFCIQDMAEVVKRELVFSHQQRSKGYPYFAKMIGYCYHPKGNCLAVVYDVNPLDTLHNLLKNDAFDWRSRMNVARKFASFLSVLHSQKKQFVICNIDPAHVIIDQAHNPFLLDFSLLFGSGKQHRYYHHTIGYFERRYKFVGDCADRADVSSFGLVLISLISKKTWEMQALKDYLDFASKKDKTGLEVKKLPRSLRIWARKRSKSGRSLVDNSFKEDPSFNDREGVQVSDLALRCIHGRDYTKRPTMGIVLRVILLCCGSYGLEPSLKQMESPTDWNNKKRVWELAKEETNVTKRNKKTLGEGSCQVK